MNRKSTRRTFIKASTALVTGLSIPAVASGANPTPIDQIREANLGEIRYIHIQCNRPDGPSLKDALAFVESLTGSMDRTIATGCGDLESQKQFLIHQPLANGGTAVFTSAHQHGSWGIVRGDTRQFELT